MRHTANEQSVPRAFSEVLSELVRWKAGDNRDKTIPFQSHSLTEGPWGPAVFLEVRESKHTGALPALFTFHQNVVIILLTTGESVRLKQNHEIRLLLTICTNQRGYPTWNPSWARPSCCLVFRVLQQRLTVQAEMEEYALSGSPETCL